MNIYHEPAVLCLSQDLIHIITKDFSSKELQGFMITCKNISVNLKIFYKSLLKKELENTVFRAKPFTPPDISKHDQKIEMRLYKIGYVYKITLPNNIIGHAQFNGTWACYCVVPIKFFNLFLVNERELNMPEITFSEKETLMIGWDYGLISNITYYTNLAMVINRIWSVWSLIHQGPQKIIDKDHIYL